MTLKIKRGIADPDAPPVNPETPSSAPAATRIRPLVPPRAPSSAKNKSKVLLTVLDGKIAWDKMTAESRKAFEDLFRDPDFLSQFGLTGKEKMFDPEQIKLLYDGISTIYHSVIGFFLRWPEPALKMLAYTDEQKAALATPTANLANKFAPAFLQKHQELLVWGAIFGAITQKNFLAAQTEAKKLMAKQPALVRGSDPRETARRAAEIITRPNQPAPADRPAPTMQVPFSIPDASEFGGNGEGDLSSLG
jgi:hypothetical protein